MRAAIAIGGTLLAGFLAARFGTWLARRQNDKDDEQRELQRAAQKWGRR